MQPGAQQGSQPNPSLPKVTVPALTAATPLLHPPDHTDKMGKKIYLTVAITEGVLLFVWGFFQCCSVYNSAISVDVKTGLSMMRFKYGRDKNTFSCTFSFQIMTEHSPQYRGTRKSHSKYHKRVLATKKTCQRQVTQQRHCPCSPSNPTCTQHCCAHSA